MDDKHNIPTTTSLSLSFSCCIRAAYSALTSMTLRLRSTFGDFFGCGVDADYAGIGNQMLL
jgi:hypothetical protein